MATDNVTRKTILDDAAKCVCQDRDMQYGNPEDSFAKIAEFWNAYLTNDVEWHITLRAHDVGIMLALLKIARIATGHTKADNYIDLAGYAACAGEIACKRETLPSGAQNVYCTKPKPITDKPSKWDGLSNSSLKKMVCDPISCKDCPIPNWNNGASDRPCSEYVLNHPDEARELMLRFLNSQT